MQKNNKNGSITVTLIIIVIVGALLYFFLPKNFFSKSKSSSGFATFDNDKRRVNDGIPGPLKWKRSFAYDKKKEKREGSYMRYMIDKRNNGK